MEIARGRSCASMLVIPQRKMTLIRALYGRRPWPDLSSRRPWGLVGEEGRGQGHGGREGGVPWCGCSSLFDPWLHAEREEEEVEEREEKEKREREKKKRKEKNWKFANTRNFRVEK
jgi:hypothetical protein